MSNMAYCRFQNTLLDLKDCKEALEDGVSNLSDDEKQARKRLIAVCVEIARDFENEADDDDEYRFEVADDNDNDPNF